VLEDIADQLVEPLVDPFGLDALTETAGGEKEELCHLCLANQLATVHALTLIGCRLPAAHVL
jgi:hypothetical protein